MTTGLHRPTPTLSERELRQLLRSRLIASVATSDSLGRIHLVPMWFVLRRDALLFPTSSQTRKVRNIREVPLATAMIHQTGGGPNVRGVRVTGPVDVLAGDEAKRLNRHIHLRYMTAEAMHEPEVIDLLQHDDVTLRLAISEVVSWKIKAGPSPRPSWSRPLD